jgi:hypothetical protein
MVRAVLIATLVGSTLALGCAGDEVSPRTQLMLVADTDIEELNQIKFTVSEGNRERTSGTQAVNLQDAPFTMAVLREEGSLGPLSVSAAGYQGDRLLLERKATVSFVRGKTLTVVLHLVRSCVDRRPDCAQDMTCTENGCAAPDAAELAPWDGAPPRIGDVMDAGTPDPDAATDAANTDAAGDPNWMQCGGRMVDVNTELDHCGRCNRSCRSGSANEGSNTLPACIAGACASTCRPLWGDCDGAKGNGCEKTLAGDSENCGACGMTCEVEDYCWAGVCRPRPN